MQNRVIVKTAVVLAIACVGVVGAGLAAQAGTPASKLRHEGSQFEVVSVKPCTSGSSRNGVRESADSVRIECLTVQDLIRIAYVVYPDGEPAPVEYGIPIPRMLPHEAQAALTGGPSWIRSQAFTIEAKAGAPSTQAAMRGPMLQDVLKKRFKLATHEQSHPMAVYELTQSQGGAKLQPAKEGGCYNLFAAGSPPPRPSGGKAPQPICGGYRVSDAGGVDASSFTMRGFCVHLSGTLDRDVIDKTGLGGVYDLHLETTLRELEPAEMRMRQRPPPAESNTPEATDPGGSVSTALRRIGLLLKPGTRAAKQIVIDHVERPDEN